MYKGNLCIVLHAHLPYVRHPEHKDFLEENWFYEAAIETYIPLLTVFEKLVNDVPDFRITLSLSPTLIEMLNDKLLRKRLKRHIEKLIELADHETHRTKSDPNFGPVARMYSKGYRETLHRFEDIYREDILRQFIDLQNAGNAEIITTAATHAYLPLWAPLSEAIRAQIHTGCEFYRHQFGRNPCGFWLPECGFSPGIDRFIQEEGMQYFFLATHGITHGKPSPPHGVYSPVICPSGPAAFGRDTETSHQVWSSLHGYPGDPFYREFYRDIGFDLNAGHVRSFIHPYLTKTFTGLKYYRVTGRTARKKPYFASRALMKVKEHAEDFIRNRERQIRSLSKKPGILPLVNAMYDAELFGHWWYEGPAWLEHVFRGIHLAKRNFTTVTASEYLNTVNPGGTALPFCEPSMSSWGERGYNDVWLNESNDYVYRHLRKATERMIRLAVRFPDARGYLKKALNQAAREILLSQHSDWPFMIRSGRHAVYAEARIKGHLSAFTSIYHGIGTGNLQSWMIDGMESRDGIFRDIDYRVYGTRGEARCQESSLSKA
jgi:1,4-alpha-glucan branching enzyme